MNTKLETIETVTRHGQVYAYKAGQHAHGVYELHNKKWWILIKGPISWLGVTKKFEEIKTLC